MPNWKKRYIHHYFLKYIFTHHYFVIYIFNFGYQLFLKVGTVFGLQGRSYVVVHSGVELDQSVDVAKLNGATLAVCLSANDSTVAPIDGSVCS